MIVYSDSKQNFMNVVIQGRISTIVEKMLLDKMRIGINDSQRRAFQNSFAFMQIMLSQSKLHDDTTISIEYTIPNTSKRIDFIVSGLSKDLSKAAVIIELKQWEQVDALENVDGLVKTFVGSAHKIVTHPSYQAWSYVSMLKDYNENIYSIPINVEACVFMHNYERVDGEGVFSSQYDDYIKKAPLFTKHDILQLSSYLDSKISSPDGHETIKLIENGIIKPSKSLQDSLVKMLEGNTEFLLLDEQKVVYEQAVALAKKSIKDRNKRVMIVEGGPGTGKSVVAINLLVALTKLEMHCRYVTKNSAPRKVYEYYLKKNGYKSTDIGYLFTGSGSFTETPSNFYSSLIIDEAHRLNEKSGMFENLGENQIKELINASLFSIFFIDHQQKIHIKDIGNSKSIETWATYLNAEVYSNRLDSQFRCNGSDGYLNWLDYVLNIRESANTVFDFDYDFRVYDDVNKMREDIVRFNTNNKSRMLAGYCWDWVSKKDSMINDINLQDNTFSMKWNLSTDIYAISSNSINEIGCIHTSQGLEFEYVGVIIGDDLTIHDGKIATDYRKRALTDQSLKGIKQIAKIDPIKAHKITDEIIKNTYKTLMTRGMKGCFIYCVNPELRDYFKTMKNANRI